MNPFALNPSGNSRPAATPAERCPSRAPTTVLLVDDDPDVRMLVRDCIVSLTLAASVYEAETGEEAWRWLSRGGTGADRPMVIFLDLEMPGSGGLALLRQIRATPTMTDIPVVMLTGVSDEEAMHAAAAAGANSYIVKPADVDAFFETVTETARYWLSVHQFPQRHLSAEASRRDAATPLPDLNLRLGEVA